jgi:peptide deformylase
MWMANHPGICPILPDNSSSINSFKSGFMALLPILRYPDPRLHKKAAPVKQVDARVRKLAADMAETMYSAPGIGLAASQVDEHIRLIVIDISEDKSQLQTFINPELLEKSGECEGEEGCLSVPGIYETVTRASHVQPAARAATAS